MKTVTTSWLLENLNQINLIDVRTQEEFQADHLEQAVNIPLEILISAHASHLNKEETYYVICRSGKRSSKAAGELLLQGYNVIAVEGGMLEI